VEQQREGKWPKVKADKQVGEWNTFHIKMMGERVTVGFNDQLTVDDAPLENYGIASARFRRPARSSCRPTAARCAPQRLHPRDQRRGSQQVLQAAGRRLQGRVQRQGPFGWTGATEAYEVKAARSKFQEGGAGTLFIDKRWPTSPCASSFKLPPGGKQRPGHPRSPLEGNRPSRA